MSYDEVFPDNPAFPSPDGFGTNFPGLTKREYFAAIALQGLLTKGTGTPEDYAACAVDAADALIAELNKAK